MPTWLSIGKSRRQKPVTPVPPTPVQTPQASSPYSNDKVLPISVGLQTSPIPQTPPPPLGSRAESRASSSISTRRTRLIIGLDYGTSYSGGAWAWFDTDIDARIQTIRGWPGNQNHDYSASKVSSEISYSHDKLYWGFDIPDDIPGLKKLRWVKLLLEPEPKLKEISTTLEISESRKQLKEDGHTEVGAASDYLTKLWEHTKARISDAVGKSIFDYAEKTIVLTIPAVWSPKARHNSLLVAKNAGLTGLRCSLKIITEPEAAAIAVLKNKTKRLKVGDCFVVCDAGGGTVDLTSYKVESRDPLRLKECAVGNGGLCGSVFLDMAFKRYLRTIVTGEVFDNIRPRQLAKMMYDFDHHIKRQFNSLKDSYPLDLYGVPPNPDIGMEDDGSIRLTRDNLMPLFDSVCSEVEQLIDQQIVATKEGGCSVKALLLVGGFGGNKYLLERLNQIYSPNEMDIIQLTGSESLEAVSTGAVLSELLGTGNVVDIHLSRINIGIVCNDLFNKTLHIEEDKFFCKYELVHLAKDQILWYVHKGDEIKTGGKTVFPFKWIGGVKDRDPKGRAPRMIRDKDPDSSEKTLKLEAHLVRSDENRPSTTRRAPEVHDYVTIIFNINPNIFEVAPQRVNLDDEVFWDIKYDVEMTMGPAMMQFSCIINGVVQDSANVVYHAAQ